MGQVLHALEAHGPGHTLEGVSCTEDLIDRILVLGLLLEDHDIVRQTLNVLIRLVNENIKVLTYIHLYTPIFLASDFAISVSGWISSARPALTIAFGIPYTTQVDCSCAIQ